MPLNNILDNKFEFMDFGISTLEVNTWKWWEYEEFIKRLNNKREKEEQARKDQEKNQPNVPDYTRKMPDVNSMMRSIGKYK